MEDAKVVNTIQILLVSRLSHALKETELNEPSNLTHNSLRFSCIPPSSIVPVSLSQCSLTPCSWAGLRHSRVSDRNDSHGNVIPAHTLTHSNRRECTRICFLLCGLVI